MKHGPTQERSSNMPDRVRQLYATGGFAAAERIRGEELAWRRIFIELQCSQATESDRR